jgi:hypothetical protein
MSSTLALPWKELSRVAEWLVPTVTGKWLGVVTFAISYAEGRRATLQFHDQLVPDYALRPRRESGDRSESEAST